MTVESVVNAHAHFPLTRELVFLYKPVNRLVWPALTSIPLQTSVGDPVGCCVVRGALVGCAVVGLAVVGFAVVGLAVVGLVVG